MSANEIKFHYCINVPLAMARLAEIPGFAGPPAAVVAGTGARHRYFVCRSEKNVEQSELSIASPPALMHWFQLA